MIKLLRTTYLSGKDQKMIADKVQLYLNEDVVVRLDSIAEEYKMTRNELIIKIIQKKLRIKTRIKGEPDMESVDKFLNLLIQEKFKGWDNTVKSIYKKVHDIANFHYLEIKDDPDLREEISKMSELNYKRFLEGKQLINLPWQMIVKTNKEKEE